MCYFGPRFLFFSFDTQIYRTVGNLDHIDACVVSFVRVVCTKYTVFGVQRMLDVDLDAIDTVPWSDHFARLSIPVVLVRQQANL